MSDLNRYNRNTIIDKIGEEGQKKLLNARVLVAGTGGLGSTVIANLAALGIGTLGLVDDDTLELTNLNRQYIHKYENIGKSKVLSAKEWIDGFNPEITVDPHQLRLDSNNANEILPEYNLVMDCFDSYRSKFMLNEACIKNGKTLIHGGVTEFYGQAIKIVPGKTACLACIIPDYDPESYILKGVISPAVSTIASIQSMEAAKTILRIGTTLENTLLTYNGLEQEYKKYAVKPNSKCPLCSNINTSVI